MDKIRNAQNETKPFNLELNFAPKNKWMVQRKGSSTAVDPELNFFQDKFLNKHL